MLGKTGVSSGAAQNEKIQENRQKIQPFSTSPKSLLSAFKKSSEFSSFTVGWVEWNEM
jgi:hypothetical protein